MTPSTAWRVLAASAPGTAHVATGEPCQDALSVGYVPPDVLIVAVADGAGSAAFGGDGAAIAVKAVVDQIRDAITAFGCPSDDEAWSTLLRNIFRESRAVIEANAATRGCAPREMASTLILVVAKPDHVAVAQIGDGAVVVDNDLGAPEGLTVPQFGEYLNETTFLVSPDAMDSITLRVWHGLTRHVAIFTDGLQMLALKAPAWVPHAPFFSPFFDLLDSVADQASATEELRRFLVSPRVGKRTTDDVTLVLASWPAETSCG